MPTLAVDFESYYSDHLSIKFMGRRLYCEETDCYMVSLVGDDGFEFVGDPKLAQWEDLKARYDIWVSHNASFDSLMYSVKGFGPAPDRWLCTADMSVYLGAGRSLADASKVLLGVEVNKAPRDKMKGRRFELLPPDQKTLDSWTLEDVPAEWREDWVKFTPKRREGIPTVEEIQQYALDDSRLCLRLFTEHGHQWPEIERRASEHTTLMTSRGIRVDREQVKQDIKVLSRVMEEAREQIPWKDEKDAKGNPVALTSPQAIATECARLKIPGPLSTAKKSEEFTEWLDKYGDVAPFITALSKWRSANRLRETAYSLLERTGEDGEFTYDLKYMGADRTGRFSSGSEAGGGINMQNFPREDTMESVGLEEVDVRGWFVARPGKTFIVADWAQVEARITLWYAGDTEQLEQLTKPGVDLYEVHARATMGYSDPRPLKEVDDSMRKLAKARVLGLGFRCGGAKFQLVAKIMAGLELSESEAHDAVKAYRKSNQKVVRCWEFFDDQLLTGARDSSKLLASEMASWRTQTYFNLSLSTDPHNPNWHRISGTTQRSKPRRILHGGTIFENLVQGTSRDLLVESVLKLEYEEGIPVVLHVHDEIICEVDEDVAEEKLETVKRVMSTAPAWAEGLPLDVDGHITPKYSKP